jgi:hypothetical protein
MRKAVHHTATAVETSSVIVGSCLANQRPELCRDVRVAFHQAGDLYHRAPLFLLRGELIEPAHEQHA